jgi:hypothetical protein
MLNRDSKQRDKSLQNPYWKQSERQKHKKLRKCQLIK